MSDPLNIRITAGEIRGTADPDAVHIQRLIGKPLQDVAITGSLMTLSFDPFGEIKIALSLDLNVSASTNAALFKKG